MWMPRLSGSDWGSPWRKISDGTKYVQADIQAQGPTFVGTFCISIRRSWGTLGVDVCKADVNSSMSSEVTIGGWIATFIIDIRGGSSSSGYISSGEKMPSIQWFIPLLIILKLGFFAGEFNYSIPTGMLKRWKGIMIGRVALIWVNKKVHDRAILLDHHSQ